MKKAKKNVEKVEYYNKAMYSNENIPNIIQNTGRFNQANASVYLQTIWKRL